MWVCRVAPGVTGMSLLRSFKEMEDTFSTDIASLRDLKFPEKPEFLLCVISTAERANWTQSYR